LVRPKKYPSHHIRHLRRGYVILVKVGEGWKMGKSRPHCLALNPLARAYYFMFFRDFGFTQWGRHFWFFRLPIAERKVHSILHRATVKDRDFLLLKPKRTRDTKGFLILKKDKRFLNGTYFFKILK